VGARHARRLRARLACRSHTLSLFLHCRCWQVGDIPTLVAYAKAAGGRLGLYGDRGENTCGGRVGQAGFEAQDAQVRRMRGLGLQCTPVTLSSECLAAAGGLGRGVLEGGLVQRDRRP
jgi:hypothetical protein